MCCGRRPFGRTLRRRRSRAVDNTPGCYFFRSITAKKYTLFLLSPARLDGERAALLFDGGGDFPLAERLRSEGGAPLGDVFSFLSSLYFRGKKAYAEAFGRAPPSLHPGLVISAGEGLRFVHEPVTVERLRAWSAVDIAEDNPRFIEPLIAHAQALEHAYGTSTRFVLLGSVASDKYVLPLLRVFGENLLFPPDFVGRGDMSRGGLLLRAARSGQELSYAPVQGATLHGPRPPRLPRAVPRKQSASEVVVLIGLPGAGKTTFFEQRFSETHGLISKDRMRNNRRRTERQSELVAESLGSAASVVVDNTNASRRERASIIAEARRFNARVVGYFFDCTRQECLARNAGRQGRDRVPKVGIFATAKRLERPSVDEGFDALYVVRVLPGPSFEVREYPSAAEKSTLTRRD